MPQLGHKGEIYDLRKAATLLFPSGPYGTSGIDPAASHGFLSTTHDDVVVNAASRGALVYGNSASRWDALPSTACFVFLQPDALDIGYTACPHIGDGASAYFGNNEDVAMGYDEAGNDQFVVTGASWFFDGPHVSIGASGGDGTLHIQTSDASMGAINTFADDLVVENNHNAGITIVAPDNRESNLYFASPSDAEGARITWGHDLNSMIISTSKVNASLLLYGGTGVGVAYLTIDADRNIFLGTGSTFDLAGNADALILDAAGTLTLSAPTPGQLDFEVGGADVATLVATSLSIAQDLGHLGDADTFWRFQDDQASLDCGGTTFIDAVEAATDYLKLLDGLNVIGTTTTNANMDVGLTVDQAAFDTEAVNIRSSDVGAVLSTVETGTYLTVEKSQGDSGGAVLQSFKDADGVNFAAMALFGHLAENVDTAKTTAARGIVEIHGFQTDGANLESTVADGNVFVVRTVRGSAVTLLVIDEDADMNLPSGRIATGHGDYWDLEDYTAGAPTADGFVRVDINGTTYQLLANLP